ncbi:MAG: prephenate/arogenate dehydrogenase [Thainema sp.]
MKIGIVGLGLIGGSLGLDWSAYGYTVLGVSRKQSTCETAIARRAVADASPNFAILAEVDVVFICTPIGSILPTIKAIAPHLKSTAIVTDVGSVKGAIVQPATELWPNFLGGHPMAGTAEVGIDAALSNLFVDRPYVLTPTPQTPSDTVEQVSQLVKALNACLIHCDPAEHDQAVAWISHLPVMISSSLIQSCLNETDKNVLKLAQQLASSGFCDTSRVGGGNPELGLMMAQYNQEALLRSLFAYRDQLDQVIQQIEAQDWSALQQQLIQTQQERPFFVE